MLGGYFNEKTFEDWIGNRFKLYYSAWKAYSGMKDDSLSDEEKEVLFQLSEVTVVWNCIICCFTDEADYHNIFPNPKERASHTACVLNHYRRFSEKADSILSHFTTANQLGLP